MEIYVLQEGYDYQNGRIMDIFKDYADAVKAAEEYLTKFTTYKFIKLPDQDTWRCQAAWISIDKYQVR